MDSILSLVESCYEINRTDAQNLYDKNKNNKIYFIFNLIDDIYKQTDREQFDVLCIIGLAESILCNFGIKVNINRKLKPYNKLSLDKYNQLKSIVINKTNDKIYNICNICNQNTKSKEKIIVLNCGHFYHNKCIKRWLTDLCKKAVCPYCQETVIV